MIMLDKILTVIVPTYNMEGYLNGCLSSLVMDNGMMDRLEVLVINDGSKDRSSEIAHGYEKRFPDSFKVIDKENGNYGSCINAALPIATGKYVKVLDADDFVNQEGLMSLLQFLDGHDCDVVITNTIDVDGEGHERGRKRLALEHGKEYVPDDFDDGLLNMLFMHELTYNMDLFRRMDYHQTEGISYTDLEWAYYPMSAARSVRFCQADVYCYRQGREGQTVAGAQRCKSMWMEDKVVRQMFYRYDSVISSASSCSKSFLKHRLSLFSARQYFYYLLEYKDFLDEKQLVDFDDFIKENNLCIYDMMNNTECPMLIGSFRYISEWRRHQSRKTVKYMLYDTYRAVSNVRHAVIGR